MRLLALLVMAQPVPAPAFEGRVEQAALLETFRSTCLVSPAALGTFAAPTAASGFRRADLAPTGFDWVEIEAWQRGGIRLTRMTDPREQIQRPMCGVSASLLQPDTDDRLIEAVGAMTNAAYEERHGTPRLMTSVIALHGGAVRIDIDRRNAPEVRVRLIAWPMSS